LIQLKENNAPNDWYFNFIYLFIFVEHINPYTLLHRRTNTSFYRLLVKKTTQAKNFFAQITLKRRKKEKKCEFAFR